MFHDSYVNFFHVEISFASSPFSPTAMNCCIILCGVRTRRKRQKKISPELQRVLDQKPICYCASCNQTREPIVYRFNRWFTLYFIPIFRTSKGPEVLLCPVCQGQLQIGSQDNLCTGCGRWNSQSGGFCPACGTPVKPRPVRVNVP